MSEALISDYLGRLEAAAWPLPATRRSELTTEVREHIETALQEAGSRDEVTIRNVLDRLGRPEEIVAAEAEGSAAGGPPPPWRTAAAGASGVMARAAARGWGAVEIAAVLLLTVGTILLWWIGPIAGAVVAWFSERWTHREKVLANVVVFGLLAVQVVLLVVFLTTAFGAFSAFGNIGLDGFDRVPFGFDFGLLGLAAVLSALLPFLAGIGAGVYLALALARRA